MQMGKVTTHVLDKSVGVPASGVRIELHGPTATLLTTALTHDDGEMAGLLLASEAAARSTVTFHVAAYFLTRRVPLPEPLLLDELTFAFIVADPAASCHVPLILPPGPARPAGAAKTMAVTQRPIRLVPDGEVVCAEGEWCACTVTLGELTADGNSISHQAINACIRVLPTLDGNELVTVEGLADPGGRRHQALVDHHGSQRVFCMPGIIMSRLAGWHALLQSWDGSFHAGG
jgi:5-hydroxyisourate hydrolase-like protein (transthyretin family)